MTYVKRLVMHGFKSFANRTEIPFEKDINVIVGPNGCGKSNIADALCFVLGRLSIKSIRAAKAAKFLELKDKKGTLEYEEYFLRYRPGDKLKSSTTTSTSTSTSTPNNNRMRIKNNRKSTMRNITNKQYKQDKSKTRQSRQTKNNANNNF